MKNLDDRIDDLMKRRRVIVERFQILTDMRSSPDFTSDLLRQINILNDQITALAREANERR
ncbi:MAG: hypothetical protein AAGB04_15480 [Pseudomonadota bacterium]